MKVESKLTLVSPFTSGLAFVFLLLSMTHTSWFIGDVELVNGHLEISNHVGLTETCSEGKLLVNTTGEVCVEYGNVLKYSDKVLTLGVRTTFIVKQKDFDVILALLIVGTVFSCTSLVLAVTIVFIQGHMTTWRRLSRLVITSTFLAGLFTLVGCTYSEIKYRNEWLDSSGSDFKYVHGWAAIFAWVAVIFELISNIVNLYIYTCVI